MRILVILLVMVGVAACAAEVGPNAETGEAVATETAVPVTVVLKTLDDLGPAPEIENELWLNTDAPVTLASQRGNVVLLEFWTFGCINCRRVIPFIQQWQQQFADEPFTVISVHYPEFSYERDVDNVRVALAEHAITYPVAIDNDRLTWGAYNQRFWPTTYLIDKNGRLRYQHIGEFTRGSDVTFAAAIEALLAE